MTELNVIRDSAETFDALVIGSGISGGWAAKEFCERGFNTLLVERGRMVEHRKDYTFEGKPLWLQPFRGKTNLAETEREQPIQSRSYAFSQATRAYFGNDRDLPYSTEIGTDFSWFRGNQLGGRSLLWARQCYRWSPHDFLANKRDGHGNDWPIRYSDIERWYRYVERFVGISGSEEGLPNLPDSEFLPPFEMTTPEIAFKAKVEQADPCRNVIIGRSANLSRPTAEHLALGRTACQSRNECDRGCSFGAAFSTQSATLPAAARTGNLTIAPNSVVHSLIYNESTGRVRGVRVVDNEDLTEREYLGKIVFLCASTLGSTQILLNSRSRQRPDGIANRSGVLGHYLMDHNYSVFASATIPGYEDEYYKGRRPTTCYIPNFRFEPSRYSRKYQRGYAWGMRAFRKGWQSNLWKKGFGAEFKHQVAQAGTWAMYMWSQGETLPRYTNSVSLHPSKKDKWGIPQLHINASWSANENAMMEDAAADAKKLFEIAGFVDIASSINDVPPGTGNHEMGTARMGRDPKTSVFNGFNQCHDVPNLFCTDGSVFCSSATQNPSLTLMALTARAVDYACRERAQHRI